MKVAVLSMDIEDWYHLDYFDPEDCDRSRSLLDGIDVYREILSQYEVSSSFFVLGDLMERMSNLLCELVREGHDVGVHGWDHTLPMKMNVDSFFNDLKRSKDTLEQIVGIPAKGYRAPCFSLDRERLDQVRKAGFAYDSSRILFDEHPLYGTLDLKGFSHFSPNIYSDGSFFEFQVSTLLFAGRNLPVSGGGYIRIFPWFLMRWLIKRYLQQNELYVLYIHPFELSPQQSPPLPESTPWTTQNRFKRGRSSVKGKLSALIDLLMSNGYTFMTFSELHKELLNKQVERTHIV